MVVMILIIVPIPPFPTNQRQVSDSRQVGTLGVVKGGGLPDDLLDFRGLLHDRRRGSCPSCSETLSLDRHGWHASLLFIFPPQ